MSNHSQTINFLDNYNGKLFNDAFSTIRLKDDKFYIGGQYNITLHSKWCGDAEIVYIKDFYLHQLNEGMAYLDTGLSVRDAQELIISFYKEQCVDATKEIFTYMILLRITKDKTKKAPIYEFYQRDA